MAGGLAAVADRMAETVKERRARWKTRARSCLAMAYGGFRRVANGDPPSRHCREIHSRRLRRGVTPEPGREAFSQHGRGIKGQGRLAAITDVAMRRLFAPEFQSAHPDLMAYRSASFLKTDADLNRAACEALAGLDLEA